MVAAESEVVLLPSCVFASMLCIFDDAFGGATLWCLVLPDKVFFSAIY